MKKVIVFVLCLNILVGAAACKSEKSIITKDIYIPVLGDVDRMNTDQDFYNGVQMAVEDCNKEFDIKGYKIRTTIMDDNSSYDSGVAMAAELSKDSTVTGVLNIQDLDVSVTSTDILSRVGKLVILPYGVYDEVCTRGYANVFCNVPSYELIGTALADHIISKGYKRIAVYHCGTAAQDALVTAIEKKLCNSRSEIVDYVPGIISKSSFQKIYDRWKALGVDLVVISQYGSRNAYEILSIIREKDHEIPVIGDTAFDNSDIFKEYSSEANGLVIPSVLRLSEDNKIDEFMKKYRERYGESPDRWSIQGYDSLRMIVDTAVSIGSADKDAISRALHKKTGYKGIQGSLVFDSNGALQTGIDRLDMLIFKSGGFTKLND